MYGLATNKATIYAAVAVSGFAGMAFPTISAMKSNNVVSSIWQDILGNDRPRIG
jgi:fucose permease